MEENEYNIVETSLSENKFQVLFSGNLSIDNAQKIQSYFQNKCLLPQDLVLVYENIDSMDVSVIQIITALILKRNSADKYTLNKFNLDSSLNELLNKSGALGLIEGIQKTAKHE